MTASVQRTSPPPPLRSDAGSVGGPAPRREVRPAQSRTTLSRRVLLAMVVPFFLLYCALPISSYLRFHASSWDLAIFTQIVQSYAHLQAPTIDIKGAGTPALGDHFHPLLVLLAPLYRVFPTPISLLVAQAALFALSIVPVARAAASRLGKRSGVAIGVAYGLSWGIQEAVAADFHEIALAVPLLAFGLEALLDRRWLAVLAWCAPLVLVKEDLGLTVACVGLVMALRGARRLGIGLCVFGLAATAVTVLVLIPAANQVHSYDYWAMLSGADSAASSSLGQWLVSIPASLFVPGIKTATILLLFGVTAYLALASPLALATIPTLAWRFLSDKSAFWGPGWHYSAILMPIVFFALLDTLARMHAGRRVWLASVARFAAPAVLTIAVLLALVLPLRALVSPASYQPSPRAEAAAEVQALIPSGSSVETDSTLVVHLVTRTRVFWLGRADGVEPDFVLLDRRAWPIPIPRPGKDLLGYIERQHPRTNYAHVYSRGGFHLFALRT